MAKVSAKHLPALDGLRGLAILLVILVHTLYAAPRGAFLDLVIIHAARLGWVGVDLFFVLSGFLITGILIDAKGSENYLRAFYARRILRIVPAYVAYVLFSLYVAPELGAESRAAASQMHQAQWWYWSYTLNILIAIRGWSVAPIGSHLWSLAVEEQFYLIWPAVVLCFSLRGLRRVTVGCFIGAELFRIIVILSRLHPEANYVLLPSRMDTLATGAFLACALRSERLWPHVIRWSGRLAAGAALATLLALLHLHTLDFHQPLTQLLAYPALAILGGALVVTALRSPIWLSSKGLRFFGKYSYAMYLWHGVAIATVYTILQRLSPPFLWGSYLPTYVALLAAVLAVTSAIALVSWYILELPCLSLKRFFEYA